MGLIEKTFEPPAVTVDMLQRGGVKDDDMQDYAGKPADEVFKTLPGQRFERSQFNIPDRPIINPSGLEGTWRVGNEAQFAEWDESLHPRDEKGKFTDGSGGGKSGPEKNQNREVRCEKKIGKE